MKKNLVEDKKFEKTDFTNETLAVADYENCTFTSCNFANYDLSGYTFAECAFSDCNLSNVKLHNTALKDIQFKNCKMLGLHFDDCNDFLFAVSFDSCMLNLSIFYKRKLKGRTFTNCTLHEVDFTEADLTSAVFDNCDLNRAVFDNTILEKADLRSAFSYSIDPDRNRIKKAKFALPSVTGLLDKYDIDIS